MREITSFLGTMPTLHKKRPPNSTINGEPVLHKSMASQPAIAASPLRAAGDSVHFSGTKRKPDGNNAGPPGPFKKTSHKPPAGSPSDSSGDEWEPRGDGSGMSALLPLLLGGGGPDFDPFNKPPVKPGQVMAEHIKPLESEDVDWEPYKEAAQPYADKLSEITSRSYKNNAVLQGDDENLKKAILMHLKQKSPDKHMFAVNCDPQSLGKLERHYKGPALPNLFAEPAHTLGLPSDKPTVLMLHNADPEETEPLQKLEAFQRIKKQNPHFRFVITQPHPPAEKEDGGMRITLGGPRSKSNDTKPAPYEHVNVKALNTEQWSKILQQDKAVKAILHDYKLEFPPKPLRTFLDKLQKGQSAPLDREQILGEIDSLASFIRIRNNDHTPEVTNHHVQEFTKHLGPSQAVVKAAPSGLSSNPMEQKPYKLVKASDIKTRLDDVVGHQHAKEVLSQALEAIKYPALYNHLNEGDKDAANNNVLLMGEPGGGKSMLAEAIAGEGKGAFISTTGSQFVNVYVGMGANNMRQLKAAIEQVPDDLVVVFMDEIDSLGSRGDKGAIDGGSREETQTINEFLAMTEGVNSNNKKKVLLIGATNRPLALDKGILSRFHYKEPIEKLNGPQRKVLLEKQMKEKRLDVDPSVDMDALIHKTEGLSGRDLRNVMKLAKQTLIRQLPESEKIRLEHDAKARKEFRLKLTQDVLEDALKEVKNGWQEANKATAGSPPPFGMYV